MIDADTPQERQAAPLAFGPTITILFSDIRGFTEYTDAYGDEAAYRMLQNHNRLLEEQIALYGGHIVKTLGDSFMVSFDAARTAVICAIAMQRAIEQYYRTEKGPKIEIGVGINTGEPVREGDDLFGGAVNLASRICGAAGPGRILVSETVRYVVGRMQGSEWLDRGFFEIKGFQEPQHLFEVEWASGGAVRATQVAPPSGAARPQAAAAPAPRAVVVGPRLLSPWLFAAGGMLLLLALAAGVAVLNIQSPPEQIVRSEPVGAAESPAAAPVSEASPWKLLRSDDFSDPARGLFLNDQRGVLRGSGPSGRPYEVAWEYGYAGNALVGRLRGNLPERLSRSVGVNPAAADKVLDDFAVEARVRATKAPALAYYALTYFPSAGQEFNFQVWPATGAYNIWSTKESGYLTSGRSTAINRGDAENLLRIEVQGDTMRVSANGNEIDRAQHEGLAQRGGQVRLRFATFGPLAGEEVEVRFADFKVYQRTN